eukprot:m.10515 g.10515  ORF g.10515 m.10515 type:complete len:549 (+) comp4275_c0_seq1:25-1671(+)
MASVSPVVVVVVASLLLHSAQALTPCTGSCETLTLVSGPIEGESSIGGGSRFLGVPFAKPPVNELRWEPPQMPEPWTTPKKTKTYGYTCYQSKNFFSETSLMSEDCLYLNIWLPKDIAKKNNTPILLFFYGGSWAEGSAMSPLYNGDSIADLYDDTIVVTTNYRLNVFGFLGSNSLRASDKSTGNFGLQDQRMAMQWCRDNAAAFHGDPNRITVFGESAGAGSISAHLVAPKSAGLFQAAIMESGPPAPWTAMPLEIAEKRFSDFVTKSGCPSGPSVVSCLRSKNASEIFHARPSYSSFLDWSPVIDETELFDFPEKLVEQGKVNPSAVLMGTNRDEGTLFAGLPMHSNETQLHDYINKLFGGNTSAVDAVYAIYNPSNFNATKQGSAAFWAASGMLGDALMTCPARRAAHWLSANTSRPVYRYFYEYELDLTHLVQDLGKQALGVFHGSELPMVFHLDYLLVQPAEYKLSGDIVQFWQHYAHNNTPEDHDDVWHRVTPTTNNTLEWSICKDGIFEEKPCLKTTTDLKKSICDFWDNIGVNFTTLLYG